MLVSKKIKKDRCWSAKNKNGLHWAAAIWQPHSRTHKNDKCYLNMKKKTCFFNIKDKIKIKFIKSSCASHMLLKKMHVIFIE
jgi:hypothetical protein